MKNLRFRLKTLPFLLKHLRFLAWIPKGSVIQEPKGPSKTSQFEHSSIPATIRDLFGLPSSLTKRDAWAGSFTELLTLDQPRTDAPMHLPSAPNGGKPPPPPSPPAPVSPLTCKTTDKGNATASLPCKEAYAGNLCVDAGSLIGSGQTEPCIDACYEWCSQTKGCTYFSLSNATGNK